MRINNTTKLLYEQKKDKFYVDVEEVRNVS